jgi:hypothetical protein
MGDAYEELLDQCENLGIKARMPYSISRQYDELTDLLVQFHEFVENRTRLTADEEQTKIRDLFAEYDKTQLRHELERKMTRRRGC